MRLPAAWGQSTSGRANLWLGVILLYFLWHAHDAVHSRFAPDDMMNLGKYWEAGPARLITGLLAFWSSSYRPMGGAFYLSIFHFAGLNPFHYRVAALLLMTVNTALLYLFARFLTGSELAAVLAALIACCHGTVIDLHYQTSSIYDVLCFLFYVAALGYYLRWRPTGLGPKHLLLITLLYIGALDSKEMAVSFPVALLLYELLCYPPRSLRLADLGSWLFRQAPIVPLTTFLTAVYVAGKLMGPDSLINIEAYRPVFTLQRFVSQQCSYMDALFYQYRFFTRPRVAAVYAIAGALAWWFRRPYMGFLLGLAFFSTLPITFLQRGWSTLSIPLAAWSVFTASLVVEAGQAFRRKWAVRPAAVWFVRVSVVVVVALLAHRVTVSYKRTYAPLFWASHQTTWDVIQELRRLDPQVRSGSSIVFLDDPFKDWDMYFISTLWFRDPTLRIVVARKMNPPLDQAAIDKFDYVFSFRDGRLLQLRP